MTVDRRAFLAAGLVAVAAATTAGCSGDTAPGDKAAAAQTKLARVYVIAPQTGSDAAAGLGTSNSVKLAFDQAARRGDHPGWKLEVVVLDDKGDKPTAAAMAKKAAADDDAVAVIGSIFSGLTKQAQAPLAAAGIPQVSPSATNPTLTRGDAYATKPRRTYPSFFRVIAADDAHGPALAKYLADQGVRRAAVVNDGDDYGKGLASAFTTAFTAGGGRIAMTGAIDPDAPPVYTPLVKKIVASKPQAVVFGGNVGPGGALSGQLKKAGLFVPLVGGDALATDLYIPMAGALGTGDLSTAAGKPLTAVEAGKTYLADYAAADFAQSATSYGPLGYDAANAVLAALRTSLRGVGDAKSARQATTTALADVNFEGTSGKVAFDRYGDITPRVVTVQKLSGGRWTPAKTFDIG